MGRIGDPVLEAAEEDASRPAMERVAEDGRGVGVLPDIQIGDSYNRGEHSGPEKFVAELPMAEGSQEGIVANPNAMGNERIIGRVLTEGDGPESSAQVLSPEMDAYIQTQMAEQAAAEQAKDQDRKPVTEN